MNQSTGNDVGLLRLCATLCAVLAVRACAGERVNYADPPAGVFIDEWMTVHMGDNKIGYAHNEVSRSSDEISTAMLVHLSLSRLGNPVAITCVQTTRERLDGIPLEFTNQICASNQTLEKRGVIEEGKVRISSKQFGVASAEVYDFQLVALMAWGALLKQHQMGFNEGTKYSFDLFDPTLSMSEPIRVDVEVRGRERIEMDGEVVDARRIDHLMGTIHSTAWADDEGTALRTTVNIAGMPMAMTRSTKAMALAEFSPPEFFMPTTIKAGRAIDRGQIRRIDYVLRLRDKSVHMPDIPQTPMQRVTNRTENSANVTVERLDHAALQSAPTRTYGDEYREYLAANPFVNSDDPAVREMAGIARGEAEGPYAVADNLRKYVTEVISEKNLDVGFASASEVCRDRQGDCTEHAVLLAALGRACGIPTRVVTGVVYVPLSGGEENVFGFHMWTQFLIGERWVDFDAAQRQTDCDPTHIAFSIASLSDAGLGQIVFGLINIIGNLDIEIESIAPSSD